MALAIFDLDHTLLDGDSDYEWGQFLIEQGVVDRATYEQANRYFYEQYQAGTLDIQEFARFAFQPLASQPMERLLALRERFVAERIRPIILAGARRLLARHAERGDVRLIITATNRFVTEPIAQELGVEHLLATEPRRQGDRFLAEIEGVPCFREGKVTRLREWLASTGHRLDEATFYSDSHNDIPLMEAVAHPVAVDPDPVLSRQARERGWPCVSLRFEQVSSPSREQLTAHWDTD